MTAAVTRTTKREHERAGRAASQRPPVGGGVPAHPRNEKACDTGAQGPGEPLRAGGEGRQLLGAFIKGTLNYIKLKSVCMAKETIANYEKAT